MSGMTWKEPPERPDGLRFEKEAREMRKNPGRAALLKSYPADHGIAARTMANAIKIGRYAMLRPAGAFDAQTATEDDGNGNRVVNVYVWFTGSDSS